MAIDAGEQHPVPSTARPTVRAAGLPALLRPRRAVTLGMSLCLHGVALLQFHLQWAALALPPDWQMDFHLLLALSALLVLGTQLPKSFGIRLTAAIARIVVFVVMGIPFGRFVEVRFELLVSLLLDVSGAFAPPGDAILTAIALASTGTFFFPLRIYSAVGTPPGPEGLLLLAAGGLVVGTVMVMLHRISNRWQEALKRTEGLNDMVSGLMSASHAYLDYAAQAERRSTEQERIRITQELHDAVGQAFTNISAMMEVSLRDPPPDREGFEELHTWVKEQAHRGLAETRAILYELRSIRDPELSGVQAINNLVSTFERSTRVKVKVEWGNLPWELGPRLNVVLYRLIQESLVNAFRHGHATEITVHFWVDDQSLIVDVIDNGRGGANCKKGIGQEGMEQRAEGVGGTVEFIGTAYGYQVHAVLPRRLMGGA